MMKVIILIRPYFSQYALLFLEKCSAWFLKYLKSLLTSIAIFQCRKMLTWPYLINHRKMFTYCYISYCSLS